MRGGIKNNYFSEEGLARYLRFSKRTIRAWRRKSYGPPFVRVGHTTYYNKASVRTWLDQQEHRPA